MRGFWTLIHRYVGLVMTLFLVVAGLTGSLLVWYDELDRAVWPVLRPVAPPFANALPLDGFALREAARARIPEVQADFVELRSHEPGRPVGFGLAAPKEGKAADTEVFVNPYTGDELGRATGVTSPRAART